MKNVNIGIVNLVVSNKLKDAYFNNTLIDESKQLTREFFDIIKSSPILQLEFKIFNNIENKYIENDLAATRYIDSNIKLFEVYTLREIEKEHEKLKLFLTEENNSYNLKKVDLYNAIDNLIIESLTDYDKIDVDSIHESFTFVLNHVKSPRENLIENIDLKIINDDVIEIAIDKFNKKYESLFDDDKNLFNKLVNYNDEKKQKLLEEYRNEILLQLERINKDAIKDSITKAIQKIKEMSYGLNTKEFSQRIDDDIISLHELKKELL